VGRSPSLSSRAGSKQVVSDLDWCGPDSRPKRLGVDEAFAYCQKLTESHYENFAVTNLWLPSEIRPHFTSIYAYCRWSDDLADETSDPERATELLRWWREELYKGFRGESLHPVFVALHLTQRNFGLSIEPFEDLLSAFLQDQSVRTYSDDAELAEYCRRSANPVGRLVLALGGCVNDKTIAWSDSVCTGLQIVNFCQDVKLDAQRGRWYLPQERMRAANIDAVSWGKGNGGSREAMASWVEQARGLLLGGVPLTGTGAGWFRRSMRLFIGGGLRLLDNIEMAGYDVWGRPIEVTKFQKVQLLIRASLGGPVEALTGRHLVSAFA